MIDPILAVRHKIAATLGIVTGAILGWHPVLLALLVFMAADIATGWIKAFVTHTLSSSASWAGGAKKAGVLVLITVFHVVDRTKVLDAVGLPAVEVAPLLCGYYCFTEIISIIENLDKAQIPMPSLVRKIAARLKKQIDADAVEVVKEKGEV